MRQGRKGEAGDQYLREAEAENVVAQRPQPRRFQFQPDDEQEKDDAEFGNAQDLLALRDHAPERADRQAGGEIAENGAESDAF